MAIKPWINGPKELLQHGLYHLEQRTEFDRRMALICIDNAVEVTLKTFLGLPKRATGIQIPRSRYEDASQSFPKLLDLLEEFASDKIQGVELADIEWLHRLRNQLYHEGNGITVEKDKVDLYAGIARQLFSSLFEVDPTDLFVRSSTPQDFVMLYASLESALRKLVSEQGYVGTQKPPPTMTVGRMIEVLAQADVLPAELIGESRELSQRRNEIVHGERVPDSQELEELNKRLWRLADHLRNLTSLR